MAGAMINWNIMRLVKSICDRLLNEFDVFMVIEGNRGLGKSTLAYKLMKLVKREMKRRKIDGYNFVPRRDLLYTQKEVIRFFHDWKRSGIGDEMVNVSFSRDFFSEGQKDLIKMINMNRDHNNFFIACIPHFKNLDTQIKKLCSMRISVVRRGLAIIQTPNRTIYSKDIWDEALNEKIEREWLKKGVQKPHYSRLTTFRGFMKFGKLTEKQEAIYRKVKNDKRNIIAREKGIEDIDEKDPFKIIYNLLIDGKIKNTAMIDGMAMANEMKPANLKAKLRRVLKDEGKNSKVTDYYNDEKTKEEIKKERKRGEIATLISDVRKKLND